MVLTTHIKPYLDIEHDRVSELASKVRDLNQSWRMISEICVQRNRMCHEADAFPFLVAAPVLRSAISMVVVGAFHEAPCVVEFGLDGDVRLGEFFHCNRRTCVTLSSS